MTNMIMVSFQEEILYIFTRNKCLHCNIIFIKAVVFVVRAEFNVHVFPKTFITLKKVSRQEITLCLSLQYPVCRYTWRYELEFFDTFSLNPFSIKA